MILVQRKLMASLHQSLVNVLLIISFPLTIKIDGTLFQQMQNLYCVKNTDFISNNWKKMLSSSIHLLNGLTLLLDTCCDNKNITRKRKFKGINKQS